MSWISFWIFRNSLKMFWNFRKIVWKILEFSKKCLEFFGIFKKCLEFFGIFKNIWNFSEFSKNRLEFFGIFKKSFGFFRNFQKKCLKMFWIFFATEQSPLPHDGAERPRRHSKKAPTSTFLGSKQRQKVARVATSGTEIDQNSEKRFFDFFLFYKDFKIFIAREARSP